MSCPPFDGPVAPGGYRWWYLDALSDDGEFGLTVIAFIGSVFSPYYARARRRQAPGLVDPLDYVALNVALYRRGGKRWSLTERGRASMERSATTLAIGPSALSWVGETLCISIDEITVPLPARLRGRIQVHPHFMCATERNLDAAGRHRWQPIAPAAHVEAQFEYPSCAWSGRGYLDSNGGDEPLENAFRGWNWSRASLNAGTVILYDVTSQNGEDLVLSLHFDPAGRCEPLPAPPRFSLSRPGWGIERVTRSDPDFPATVVRTLEDTPFYARSLVRTRLFGQTVTAIHESLSLERFAAPWVQALLPFRMPRNTRASRRRMVLSDG